MSLPIPTRTDKTGLVFGQFYPKHNVIHPGIDYNFGKGWEDLGQPVITPSYGVVEYVSSYALNGGLGLYVVIYHPHHGVWTRYLHLKDIFVNIGQIVEAEQEIGTLGMSGTDAPHLHFEVLNWKGLEWIKNYFRPYGRYPSGENKKTVFSMWIDPEKWLAENSDPFTTTDLNQQLKIARKAIIHAKGARLLRLQRKIERLLRMI